MGDRVDVVATGRAAAFAAVPFEFGAGLPAGFPEALPEGFPEGVSDDSATGAGNDRVADAVSGAASEGGALIASGAVVLDFDDDSAGYSDEVTVTLQVADMTAVLAVAAAADEGAVTLIRTWAAP